MSAEFAILNEARMSAVKDRTSSLPRFLASSLPRLEQLPLPAAEPSEVGRGKDFATGV